MKTLVIDAIVGIGFPSVLLAEECRKAGLAYFNGNQWNPSWAWDREQLQKVDEVKLQELYTALREAREEGSVAEPSATTPLIQLN